MADVKYVVCKARRGSGNSFVLCIFDVSKRRKLFPYNLQNFARLILGYAKDCVSEDQITNDLTRIDDLTVIEQGLESVEYDFEFSEALKEVYEARLAKDTVKYGGAPVGAYSSFMEDLSLTGPCE